MGGCDKDIALVLPTTNYDCTTACSYCNRSGIGIFRISDVEDGVNCNVDTDTLLSPPKIVYGIGNLSPCLAKAVC